MSGNTYGVNELLSFKQVSNILVRHVVSASVKGQLHRLKEQLAYLALVTVFKTANTLIEEAIIAQRFRVVGDGRPQPVELRSSRESLVGVVTKRIISLGGYNSNEYYHMLHNTKHRHIRSTRERIDISSALSREKIVPKWYKYLP